MVSFAPFFSKNNHNGFWQFNKVLFLRILTSALYSGVLYIGLALAIWAVGKLWDIHFNNLYLYIFVFIATVFNSTFFLAGIPKDFDELEKNDSYPKGLKIFTQYILIPLMTIYLVILCLYEIKILFQRTLPDGIVSWLIMGYAVFGILSLLLIYPIREEENNKWIKTFSRIFYIMLFPLLVLLFIAIGIRIGDYGVTEERYTIVAIGLWLTFIAFYSLWKSSSIKFIPISLCLFALLSVYGPQSAPSISLKSQINQLAKIIQTKNGERDRGAGIITHITKEYGMTALQPLTKVPLKPIEQSFANRENGYYNNRWKRADTLGKILHIDDYYDKDAIASHSYSIVTPEQSVVKIKGYDYMIDLMPMNADSITIENSVFYISEQWRTYTLRNRNKKEIRLSIDSLVTSIRTDIKNNRFKKINTDTYVATDSVLSISKTLDGYLFVIQVPKIIGISREEKDEELPSYYFNNVILFIKKID